MAGSPPGSGACRVLRIASRSRASRASAASLRRHSAGRPAVRRGTEVMFLARTGRRRVVFATADGYLHCRYRTPMGRPTRMRVPVQKWGNSLALRIPKPFAEDVGVSEGTVVDVSISKGRLIAAPVAPRRARLGDLLRRLTKRNPPGAGATGPPICREAWKCPVRMDAGP